MLTLSLAAIASGWSTLADCKSTGERAVVAGEDGWEGGGGSEGADGGSWVAEDGVGREGEGKCGTTLGREWEVRGEASAFTRIRLKQAEMGEESSRG